MYRIDGTFINKKIVEKYNNSTIKSKFNTIEHFDNVPTPENNMQDPSMQDPSMQEPNMQDPNMQDSSMQDPSMQDSSMQDSSIQDPSMQDVSTQDPSMQDASMQGASMQNPSMQDMNINNVPSIHSQMHHANTDGEIKFCVGDVCLNMDQISRFKNELEKYNCVNE